LKGPTIELVSRELALTLAGDREVLRQQAAELMEKSGRENGLRFIVTTRGTGHSVLHFKWDGCDEYELDGVIDDSTFVELQKLAQFWRVECGRFRHTFEQFNPKKDRPPVYRCPTAAPAAAK